MPEESTKSNIHLIYGILFTVIALAALIALVVVRSQADTATQQAVVSNNAPTVDTVITTETSGGVDDTDGIAMTDRTTKTIYVRGQATDVNGCSQISLADGTWTAKVYRTGAAGAGSGATCTTADNNDCYNITETTLALSNCTAPSGTTNDTTVDYQFTVTLQYYADATDTGSAYASDTWTSRVDATDSGALSGNNTDALEVNSSISLDVAASLSYGTMALNATSAADTALTFTATGNRSLDIQASAGGDMVCTGQGSANIPIANAKYSVTANTAYASMTALSTTATEAELTLSRRTNDAAASTKDLYWKLQTPATGVSGTCQNTITATAIADEAA